MYSNDQKQTLSADAQEMGKEMLIRKKSSSFRSKIPVRRNEMSQRRYDENQPQSPHFQRVNYSNDSMQTMSPHMGLHHARVYQRNHPIWSNTMSSSTSYTSSDESQLSEAPLQVSKKSCNVN